MTRSDDVRSSPPEAAEQSSLTDRVVLITGASRGIGREIALGVAAAGGRPLLAARDVRRLESVATEIADTGGHASVYPLDVRDIAAIRDVMDRALADHGRIDALINNAGVNSAHGPAAEIPPEAFAAIHAVNTVGLYACCHAALPSMIERRYGRIVNMSSLSALRREADFSAYASSKAAVNAVTIAIAEELRAFNVLVNAMSPGSIRTDMNPEAETPASEAVPTALWLASLPDDGPTGRQYRFMREIPMLPEHELI